MTTEFKRREIRDDDGSRFAIIETDTDRDAVCKILVANPEHSPMNQEQLIELSDTELMDLFSALADVMNFFGRDPIDFLTPETE